jgi:hypothetical protein
MALGELVGEGRGKITTMRVLPDGKMEVSQQGTGKLLGSEISDAATYWTVMRPNGTAYGEGQQAIIINNNIYIADNLLEINLYTFCVCSSISL